MNLYGPPLNLPETRGLKRLTKKAATLGLLEDMDYLTQYNNFPQHASTYRGRVLVKERVVDNAPKAHEKDKVKQLTGLEVMGVCNGIGRIQRSGGRVS